MLQSERLIFRPYTDSDFDFYASLLADEQVVRFIGDGKTKTREEAEQRFEGLLSRYQQGHGLGLMLAVRKEDLEPVGHAGLIPQTIEGAHETEIGYWLARQHWGLGYASEAAAAFRDYGFRGLGKARLVSIIQPDNVASIRVAEKIGMTFERSAEFRSIPVSIYSIRRK